MLRALITTALLFALPALADEVTLHTPSGDLHGTYQGMGTGPVVLMIAGSGPTNRNGNATAMGLNTDMYKLLADGLMTAGIRSLRTDKRGVGESRGALTAEKDLTIQTYADDVQAWAAQLRKTSGAPCVWLLGHSEGALLAEMVAQQDKAICGLVLVAGPGRPLGWILREQMHANPANPPQLLEQFEAILSQLEVGHADFEVPPPLAVLFRPSVQPYLISELTLDPAAMLAKTRLPVLILQGETDLQVSPADAKLLAAAKPDAKLMLVPGANHLLKSAPADRAGNITTYTNPTLPLAPSVVDAITQFIKSHP